MAGALELQLHIFIIHIRMDFGLPAVT